MAVYSRVLLLTIVLALTAVPGLAQGAPVLEHSTFVGGDGTDDIEDVAVDGAGFVYVTGNSSSRDLPVSAGAAQTALNGEQDAYVAKFTADGRLVYATYLGGMGSDNGVAIAADDRGSAYVVGIPSPEFRTTSGAFDRTQNGGDDAFVAKLTSTGALAYSTLLGGRVHDLPADIAVDADGSAYVTAEIGYVSGGSSDSGGFPTTVGSPSFGGYTDASITKLTPDGSGLAWSRLQGGEYRESGLALAVDARGAVVLAVAAQSPGLATAGAFDEQLDGGQDALLSSFDAATGSPRWATYLGGEWGDVPFGVAVAPDGGVYVAGSALSPDFPGAPSADSLSDAGFVSALSGDGAALRFSTRVPGMELGLFAVALDGAGGVWASGTSQSSDVPVSPAGRRLYGGSDAYAVRLSSVDGSRLFSTNLGGSYGYETGATIAALPDGRAWLTGVGNSSDHPLTADASNAQGRGIADGFLARLNPVGTAFIDPPTDQPGTGEPTGPGPVGPGGSGEVGGTAPLPAARVRLTGVTLTGRVLGFQLSRAAGVRAVLTGKVAGRRSRGRCRRTAKTGRRCKLTITRRATYTGRSGANRITVRFPGLRKGRYRLKLTAVTTDGSKSTAATVTLRLRR